MTWKQAVRDELVRYRQEHDCDRFTLQEFYSFAEDRLAAQYPDNNHVQSKIRQVLQRLRDDGEIVFVNDSGRYDLSNRESAIAGHDSLEDHVEEMAVLDQLEAELDDL